jgi:hypothetical protein
LIVEFTTNCAWQGMEMIDALVKSILRSGCALNLMTTGAMVPGALAAGAGFGAAEKPHHWLGHGGGDVAAPADRTQGKPTMYALSPAPSAKLPRCGRRSSGPEGDVADK